MWRHKEMRGNRKNWEDIPWEDTEGSIDSNRRRVHTLSIWSRPDNCGGTWSRYYKYMMNLADEWEGLGMNVNYEKTKYVHLFHSYNIINFSLSCWLLRAGLTLNSSSGFPIFRSPGFLAVFRKGPSSGVPRPWTYFFPEPSLQRLRAGLPPQHFPVG